MKLFQLAAAFLAPLPLFAAPHLTADMAVPGTSVTINGNSGGITYSGVGAILGGGGTARYLEEYPKADRTHILDYLFKDDFGASLQILKLEIGGDGNSTAGAEPSVEHSPGKINCSAGYELTIAKQALAIRPDLRFYGLQWDAPGWVGSNGSLFTSADIKYLIDWLGCAKKRGVPISYLGGWNERDKGTHSAWFHSLRLALDANGYRRVQLVAGDSNSRPRWAYAPSPDIAILGEHNNCRDQASAQEYCTSTAAARESGKPLWASELGDMDAGARAGCAEPCAPAMARTFTREYIDARVTGELEWPAIDSYPAHVLKYENRGLLTADEPWSGHYQVNAMTWVIAHITQFASPPAPSNPGGWKFVRSASGYLAGKRTNGSYVTLLRSTHDEWSTILETTASTAGKQRVTFTVRGGRDLAGKTVHVWSSNFSPTTGRPSQWFVRQHSITPVHGRFTLTVLPDHVYSLTTTTGQGKGTAPSPAGHGLRLPYRNSLSAGTNGQPHLLATQDGAFELASCHSPDGSTTCAKQMVPMAPVFWTAYQNRHPYAIIGSTWADYTARVDVMLPRQGSVGLIGRFKAVSGAKGLFDGYVFDVSTGGTFTLEVSNGGAVRNSSPGQLAVTPPHVHLLASGTIPFGAGTWHRLSLTVSGRHITAGVDGAQVASLTDSSQTAGPAGIEAGGWYPAYFSNLSITKP